MPKFVIERDMPGLGKLSTDELKAASQTSCVVLKNLGPQIQWLQSCISDNKMYCVYIAPNAELVREHASKEVFLQTWSMKSQRLLIRLQRNSACHCKVHVLMSLFYSHFRSYK